jgi:hypothetical protein
VISKVSNSIFSSNVDSRNRVLPLRESFLNAVFDGRLPATFGRDSPGWSLFAPFLLLCLVDFDRL